MLAERFAIENGLDVDEVANIFKGIGYEED